MAEHHVTGDYYRRIAAARKPVFSIGTLAMAVTMVDGHPRRERRHRRAAADRPRDDRVRRHRLQSRRGQDRDRRPHRIQPHRRRGQSPDRVVTAAVLELAGVVKDYRGLRPLRIERAARRRRRIASRSSASISASAEVFVNLVTGATLPDAGEVSVFGRPTRAIADSADWLATRRSLRHRQRARRAARRADRRSRTWRCRSRSTSSRRPTRCARAPRRWRARSGCPRRRGRGRSPSSTPAGWLRVRLGRALALDPGGPAARARERGLSPRRGWRRSAAEIRAVAARARRRAAWRRRPTSGLRTPWRQRVLTLEPATGRLNETATLPRLVSGARLG